MLARDFSGRSQQFNLAAGNEVTEQREGVFYEALACRYAEAKPSTSSKAPSEGRESLAFDSSLNFGRAVHSIPLYPLNLGRALPSRNMKNVSGAR
jgi:hypothetical protein